MNTSATNTRRWQRHPTMDLPVRILPCSRLPTIAMTGRGTELSHGGGLYIPELIWSPMISIEVSIPGSRSLKSYANRSQS